MGSIISQNPKLLESFKQSGRHDYLSLQVVQSRKKVTTLGILRCAQLLQCPANHYGACYIAFFGMARDRLFQQNSYVVRDVLPVHDQTPRGERGFKYVLVVVVDIEEELVAGPI